MNNFDRVQKGTFSLIAPLGTGEHKHIGRLAKKPWEYAVTAAIPHLDTIEPLKLCVELLRAQTERPYILIVDTGSPPDVLAELEAMRAEDLEIAYVPLHGYRHSSEPVTIALDLAHAACRTNLLFHTHSDCFLRRPDLLENWARICNANTPVVGYRMSPREWATREWEWMVGHVALMCYMPSIHRAGATWSMQRMFHSYGYAWNYEGVGGWPDTELAFNHAIRDAGIAPVFLGFEENHKRSVDDNIDHVRSFPGSKIYATGDYHERARGWMMEALREGWERVALWSAGVHAGGAIPENVSGKVCNPPKIG